MIELNYDYSSLYENIDEIEKYLLENENDLTVLNFYKYFVNFFPVRKNLKFYFSNTDSLHNLVENGLNDIYSKRNIYKNTVDLFYSEIKRKLKLTIDNLNYISISIPSKEQQEILHSFFATAGVKLEKLFLKYEMENKIFHQPYSIGLDQTYGTVFYNPFSEEPVLFLDEADDSILEMSVIVHEFGHVLDYVTYNETHSNKETDIYGMLSPYAEVNSIYQEFKFYEYLLKNNIYKTSVKNNICEGMYEGYLEDLYNLSSLNKNIGNSVNKKFAFKNSVLYGYGLMIALSILDDSDTYDKFQEIRNPYFNENDLEKIGFTSDRISKVMIKKVNEYFGGSNDKTK